MKLSNKVLDEIQAMSLLCSSCSSKILFDGNTYSNNRIQRGRVELAVLPPWFRGSTLWWDGEKSEPLTSSATPQDMEKWGCHLASLEIPSSHAKWI